MARSPDDGNGDAMNGARRFDRKRSKSPQDIERDPAPSRRRDRVDAPTQMQRASVNEIRPSARRARSSSSRDDDRANRSHDRPDKGELAQARYVIPEAIRERFVQVGNKYHFADGTRAFTDHGKRLTSPSENTEVIKSLVSIAQARGWSEITVSGTDRFKKEAWFAARSAGLDVRGHSPTEFEQGRLVRMLARAQTPSPGPAVVDRHPRPDINDHRAAAAHRQGDVSSPSHDGPRERGRTLQTGRLIDHGPAPYRHDPKNDASYFLRIETPTGEREIWGVDLKRALNQSLSRPRIGDEIGVRALKWDAVKVHRPEHDSEGRVIGTIPVAARRNGWIVEKREFFRERSQAARVLRDASIDRQHAVKQHPELWGTYLQLHAAELAAKTLRNPEDRQRFVASVRAALADSVARGEPLSPVPLKEPTMQPPAPSARRRSPPAREPEHTPVRS